MTIVVLGNQSRSLCNFWSVLVRHMRACGHTVICAVPDDTAPEEEASRARLAEIADRLATYPLNRKGISPLADLATLRALARLFTRENVDLLFATTIKPVIYGCLAAKWAKVPHVYATITGLGYAFEQDRPLKKLVHKIAVLLYRVALAGIAGVFFQNPEDAEVFRSDGILSADSRVLFARGTGVDTRHFAFVPFPATETGFVFLFVGRLLYAKGLEDFVGAAREVLTAEPCARFQILGPREHGLGAIPEALLQSWIAIPGIEYLGETRDVRPYLACAHVVVLPSWREGTPTAILEAMSVGRPCLVTDAPGCREVVVDGETGYQVPVRNKIALAKAMLRCCTDAPSCAQMGLRARDRAEKLFDADCVADHILREMKVYADPYVCAEQRTKV